MNNRDFDWGLIPSFLAALDHGSLLGAARATRQSQPTLGRHVAELESQLSLVLFERTGRGLKPTAAALELAEAARAMEASAARLARLACSAGQAIEGTVRLSASQSVACHVLPPILARMRLALPAVSVELVVSNALSNLLLREADIALRMVKPEQGAVVAQRVAHVGLCACASQAYLARRGTPQQASDLLAHDLIAGDQERDVEAGFQAHGLPHDRLSYALRTDDLNARWAAVCAGLGLGFVPRFHLAGAPHVQAVLPALRLPEIALWLVAHRELRTSARIRAVFDFLARELPAAMAEGPAQEPTPRQDASTVR
jgi:DNA-binding transcriptional LysR family regulator